MKIISKTILVFFIPAFIFSCSIFKPTPIAYHCPVIHLPPDPIISLNKINDKSKPDEIIKSWVYTAIAYKNWNKIVRKQIKNSS